MVAHYCVLCPDQAPLHGEQRVVHWVHLHWSANRQAGTVQAKVRGLQGAEPIHVLAHHPSPLTQTGLNGFAPLHHCRLFSVLEGVASGEQGVDMKRMQTMIRRSILKNLESLEQNPDYYFAFGIIGDFLFADRADEVHVVDWSFSQRVCAHTVSCLPPSPSLPFPPPPSSLQCTWTRCRI